MTPESRQCTDAVSGTPLAKYTHHLPTCARASTTAENCTCGLQEAWQAQRLGAVSGAEEAARIIHQVLCGCAASEPDGANDQWCDSIYLVAAERVIGPYRAALRRIAENPIPESAWRIARQALEAE
jgi:hypothetical protein